MVGQRRQPNTGATPRICCPPAGADCGLVVTAFVCHGMGKSSNLAHQNNLKMHVGLHAEFRIMSQKGTAI